MIDYIVMDTRDWAFSMFARMPNDEFSNELKTLVSARNVYMHNDVVDSFVFEYLDTVYDIMRDVLVCKALC